MSQRHLAIFLPIINGGGAERIIRHLASSFTEKGIRCDILVATDKGPPLEEYPAGVQVIRLHKKKSRSAIISLARYIKENRPDVVLSTVFSANIAAIIATKILTRGTRLVVREAARTDAQIQAARPIHKWVDWILRRYLYPKADFIISVSNDVQRELRSKGLARDGRSAVIVNPLTRSRQGSTNASIGEDQIDVLACGRLEAQKDYPTLLRALALVHQRRPISATILGEGSLITELQSLAESLGIKEVVRFEGFRPDPIPYMHRAAVFVHTSIFEGFGNVVLEALSAGCQVVATDSPGGVRELLSNGEFGTLVPVGDYRSVAESILDILSGRTRHKSAAEYMTKYSADVVVCQYIEILFG